MTKSHVLNSVLSLPSYYKDTKYSRNKSEPAREAMMSFKYTLEEQVRFGSQHSYQHENLLMMRIADPRDSADNANEHNEVGRDTRDKDCGVRFRAVHEQYY